MVTDGMLVPTLKASKVSLLNSFAPFAIRSG